MKRTLHRWLLLISLSSTLAIKNSDLPLCPTNLQYFPQNLPMHCRMPGNSQGPPPPQAPNAPQFPQFPTLPPMPESFYQSLPPDKQAPPIPVPIPPFPGMPGMPMPGPMPGMAPMPMPMPVVGGPPHKLPVIVMPFYSPDNSFKKPPHKPPRQHRMKPRKKPRRKSKRPSSDSDTDDDSDENSSGDNDDSSSNDFWRGRRKASRRFLKRQMKKRERKNKKKDLLTPILQYVTKDGYVIFEKKISNSEAKDWLKPKSEANEVEDGRRDEKDNIEIVHKSVEDHRKVEQEELRLKVEERSTEIKEPEASTPKIRKFRLRKGNNAVNKPDHDS